MLVVLAILATASEFNWGTMRLTFQAVPSRVPALLAKVAVVGAVGAGLGLVVGFGSWGLATLVHPDADLALHSGAEWRSVLGQSLVFLLAAVAGVGVALLLRSVAFALTAVLVWTQVLEGLVVFIPGAGKHIYQWMPFHAADQFVGAGGFGAGALQLPPAPRSARGATSVTSRRSCVAPVRGRGARHGTARRLSVTGLSLPQKICVKRR